MSGEAGADELKSGLRVETPEPKAVDGAIEELRDGLNVVNLRLANAMSSYNRDFAELRRVAADLSAEARTAANAKQKPVKLGRRVISHVAYVASGAACVLIGIGAVESVIVAAGYAWFAIIGILMLMGATAAEFIAVDLDSDLDE